MTKKHPRNSRGDSNHSDLPPRKPNVAPTSAQKDRRTDRPHDAGGRFEPFQPTEQQRITVCLARSNGLAEESIAPLVDWPRGIAVETLKKYFARELSFGLDYINTRMTGSLVGIGTQTEDRKAAFAAQRWWLQNKAGWKGEEASAKVSAKIPGGIPEGENIEFTLTIGNATDRGEDVSAQGEES